MSSEKTHIDEADHLRLQLAIAQAEAAQLRVELVRSGLAEKYGQGVSYDANTLEIKRPADVPKEPKK